MNLLAGNRRSWAGIVKKARKGQDKGQKAKKKPVTSRVTGFLVAAGEGFEFDFVLYSSKSPEIIAASRKADFCSI